MLIPEEPGEAIARSVLNLRLLWVLTTPGLLLALESAITGALGAIISGMTAGGAAVITVEGLGAIVGVFGAPMHIVIFPYEWASSSSSPSPKNSLIN